MERARMNELLGSAALLGFILCACVISRMQGYKRGYLAGREDARREDREREADWWIRAEKGVDGARQQIWREEETKGEWL
jgi:hypothetical protein